MFTIIKKELKTYFRKGSAYFFIAASLFVSGILAAAYNLYLGSSQIEIILPTCAIVFALPDVVVIPCA